MCMDNTCYLIWEYFACPKNTVNKQRPREMGGGAYLQIELEKGDYQRGGLIDLLRHFSLSNDCTETKK